MTSTTTASKKGLPAISVNSDPLSREVLFLIVLKWLFFLLSCKIIYYLLDSRNGILHFALLKDDPQIVNPEILYF